MAVADRRPDMQYEDLYMYMYDTIQRNSEVLRPDKAMTTYVRIYLSGYDSEVAAK